MCDCSLFVAGNAASTLRPTHETLLVAFPSAVNKRCVGFLKSIGISKTRFFIHDEIPNIENAKVFDIDKHDFDHLQNISYQHARERNCSLLSGRPVLDNSPTEGNPLV
jgi:hypothetical protein